jgi:hypothetical protein
MASHDLSPKIERALSLNMPQLQDVRKTICCMNADEILAVTAQIFEEYLDIYSNGSRSFSLDGLV